MKLNSTSSSSSSSSSNDSAYIFFKVRKPRAFQERIDADYSTEAEFKRRFRFTKETVSYILELIITDLEALDERGTPLSPRQQLMLTLRYYATGSFQAVVGDLFGVSQSTVCRIVHKVSRSIAKLSKEFIKMPTPDEIPKTMAEFYGMKGIPKIIGCIDGCHVPIKSPGGDNPELYRNRKGFFSINIQGIFDAKSKFVDIVVRWHGSAHDQTIFNFSSIKQRLQNEEFNDGILLGDKGYGCSNNLITPYRIPNTVAQKRFNTAHSGTRSCIERCFGIWKKRFPIIAMKSQISVQNLLTIIVSTAILHNIAIDRNDHIDDDDIIETDYEKIYNMRNEENTELRDLITRTFE